MANSSQFSEAMSSILHQTNNNSIHQEPYFAEKKKNLHRNVSKRKFIFGTNKNAITVIVKESFIEMNHVWPSAILMAEYLYANPNIVVSETILELGAGCGLPSFLCCKLGANQVFGSDATKYPNVLKQLTESAELNGDEVSEIFEAVGLTWGRFTKETIKLRPTLIIGTDLFYDDCDYEDILANVNYYFTKGAKAFYTVIQRRATTKRIAGLLLKWKMKCEEIDILNFILNSDYLSFDDTEKLMMVKITPSHSLSQSDDFNRQRTESIMGLMQ
eukprot:CAMPEP_0197058272 /NCGR_PEP_ID=MMETSP1384-20130603/105818_1 /TAXON_ID=29189 /ORGANISM="Ammonia sp." /LENGTH=272 /DNA_ID=CAMNT_0042492957 /DNA_START=21 /DNA_END=839 /DNA_ORIENTATION=-